VSEIGGARLRPSPNVAIPEDENIGANSGEASLYCFFSRADLTSSHSTRFFASEGGGKSA
jgi:hypothetical protein